MLKNKLILSLIFLSGSLLSQIELVPGPILEHDKSVHLYQVIGKSEESVFSLWVNTRGKGGNDEFYLEKHNLKTLAPEFSVPIIFPEEKGKYPVMEQAFLTLNKIVFLTSMHKSHQKMLYAQAFDFSGKLVKAAFHLDSIEIKTPNNSRFEPFYDHDADVIIIKKTGFTNPVTTNSISVFKTSDFSKIIYRDFSNSVFRENSENYNDFQMDSKGQLHFIAGSIDETKGKNAPTQFSMMIISQNNSETIVKIGDEGEYIYSAEHLYIKEKNIFLIGGFKERDKKTYSFIIIIDALGQIIQKKELELNLSDENRFIWKTFKGTDKVKFGLDFYKLLYEDNTAWIVGEQRGYLSGGGPSGGPHGNDDFYFYDLIASHFDLENNTRDWTNFEKREHLKTRYVNGSPTNYLYIINSDLHIMYLDSPNNIAILQKGSYMAEDLEKVIEHNNSTLVIGKIDSKNKITRQTSTNELASHFHLKCRIVPNATGPTPNNYLCLRLSDDSFLVFLEDDNIGRWAIAKNIK